MKLGLYGTGTMYIIWLALLGLYLFQAFNCWAVNKDLMTGKKTLPRRRSLQLFSGGNS